MSEEQSTGGLKQYYERAKKDIKEHYQREKEGVPARTYAVGFKESLKLTVDIVRENIIRASLLPKEVPQDVDSVSLYELTQMFPKEDRKREQPAFTKVAMNFTYADGETTHSMPLNITELHPKDQPPVYENLDPADKTTPICILPHGFLAGSEGGLSTMEALAVSAKEQFGKIAVLTPNGPGYNYLGNNASAEFHGITPDKLKELQDQERTILKADNYQLMLKQMVDQIREKHPDNPIIIIGHSYGAEQSTMMLHNNPDMENVLLLALTPTLKLTKEGAFVSDMIERTRKLFDSLSKRGFSEDQKKQLIDMVMNAIMKKLETADIKDAEKNGEKRASVDTTKTAIETTLNTGGDMGIASDKRSFDDMINILDDKRIACFYAMLDHLAGFKHLYDEKCPQSIKDRTKVIKGVGHAVPGNAFVARYAIEYAKAWLDQTK